MLDFHAQKGVRFCDGLSRRDFLRVGALGAGAVGLSLADLEAGAGKTEVNCIVLFLVGGPSHIDTWDPKPDAPDDVRGPFRPIATRIPGIHLAESFPRMAGLAHRYALVRSVHHDEAPIHETGHQLMQTGRLARGGEEFPHYGSVLSHHRGQRVRGVPPFVVLGGAIGNTGVSIGHGQTAGSLGPRHEPLIVEADPAQSTGRADLLGAVDRAQRDLEAEAGFQQGCASRTQRAFDLFAEKEEVRRAYGPNTFGQSCLLARRVVEHGLRLVTVNMFDTVFNRITWDCHADGGVLGTRLDDYRDTLCPMFDTAYSALLEDLAGRGMLETTLVLAMGEFGRTPKLNPRGGRDHWPGCWTVLFAGGGVRGGQAIGASDRIGSEPSDRPVSPAEVAASVHHALGINPRTLVPDKEESLVGSRPIGELFQS